MGVAFCRHTCLCINFFFFFFFFEKWFLLTSCYSTNVSFIVKIMLMFPSCYVQNVTNINRLHKNVSLISITCLEQISVMLSLLLASVCMNSYVPYISFKCNQVFALDIHVFPGFIDLLTVI